MEGFPFGHFDNQRLICSGKDKSAPRHEGSREQIGAVVKAANNY